MSWPVGLPPPITQARVILTDMAKGGILPVCLKKGGVVLHRWTWLLWSGAVSASTLIPVEVRAGGNDQPYPVGELASTMGGAAVAIIHDGASSWYNPAGLGRVTEEGISATLSVYGLQMERTRGFVEDADLSGTTTAIFPGSLGYVKPLGASAAGMRHAVGLAVVVPDFTRHELALGEKVTDSGTGYELNVRARLLEETLWVVPGWGACFGSNFCIGAALHVGYWSSTGLYSIFEQYVDPANGITAISQVVQPEFSAALLSGSMGVQWQVSNGFWLGSSLRLPARTVWGSGRLLVVESLSDASGANPDYVRRAADDKMKIDQRLPLNLRLGLGFDSGAWLLAADLSLSLSQATYASVRAGDGSDSIQPKDPNGTAVGDVIQVGKNDARNAIFNVSVGAQYRISPKTAVQGGFFTDFSGRPDALIDPIRNHMNHYGVTAGLAMKGASSTTYVGIIAALGVGTSRGITFDAQGNTQDKRADAQSDAIYFTLGGSTRLGEAPEPKAPPSSPPPEEVQPAAPPIAPTIAPEAPKNEPAKLTPKVKHKPKAKHKTQE
jgi:hypothetical protein